MDHEVKEYTFKKYGTETMALHSVTTACTSMCGYVQTLVLYGQQNSVAYINVMGYLFNICYSEKEKMKEHTCVCTICIHIYKYDMHIHELT